MKNIIKILTISIFLFLFIGDARAEELDIQSKNAIVYNKTDNEVLYEKAANDKIMIASLTKIMTAIITLENVDDLRDEVTLINDDFKGIAEEGLATAGFKSGQAVSYTDLLYGLLLPSGAEAANALARVVGKTDENFIKLMNDKAKELNLSNTHFSNVIGIDDENNYSTVKDILVLFDYALENETFKNIITAKTYTMSDDSFSVRNNVSATKNLLGGKTGTTNGAGLCLASTFMLDGVTFISITAGAPYDQKGSHNLEDASAIYQYFQKNYEYRTIISPEDKILTLKTKYLKDDNIDFYATKKIVKYVSNDFNKKNIVYKYNGKKVITSDMEKGEKLGVVDIYYKNEKIGSMDIILNIEPKFDIFNYSKQNIIIPIIIGIIILMVIIIIVKKCRKK